MATTFELHPIGRVRSPIQSREQAPKQGDEGAPEAWLEIDPAVAEAARHLRVGEEGVGSTLSISRGTCAPLVLLYA